MSLFDRKRTFMIKILGPSKYKKNLKIAKSHIYRVLGASKVKSLVEICCFQFFFE
jgi:hypothetical protein